MSVHFITKSVIYDAYDMNILLRSVTFFFLDILNIYKPTATRALLKRISCYIVQQVLSIPLYEL